LRRYLKDESVDLIYLDPPFNSRQDYNVLFAEKDGARSSSQIMAAAPRQTQSAKRTKEISPGWSAL
jgi:16S rRNA G966 N2-methylase RsmD